ncbi:MAG: hypothetical protein V2A74_11115 [bacterium]
MAGEGRKLAFPILFLLLCFPLLADNASDTVSLQSVPSTSSPKSDFVALPLASGTPSPSAEATPPQDLSPVFSVPFPRVNVPPPPPSSSGAVPSPVPQPTVEGGLAPGNSLTPNVSDPPRKPPEFKYDPPLSISNSIDILKLCSELLDPQGAEFKDYRRANANKAIQIVIAYVQSVDKSRPNLSSYRWYFLGEQNVSDQGDDEDTFRAKPPIARVMALAVEAQRSDAFIHEMLVVDMNNDEILFTPDKWIEADLPRREVFYLYYPVHFKEVRLRYAHTTPNTNPRVLVYAGVTSVPEYAKEAIYYLEAAIKANERYEFEGSRKLLKQAMLKLLNYKWNR